MVFHKAFRNYFGDEAIELSSLEIDENEILVEGVGKDVKEAIEILSLCGLNDAFLFLRRFKELSDGQKYRYKLAKLLDRKEKSVWIIDEFCASLDRVMAKIIAFLIQKTARKTKWLYIGNESRLSQWAGSLARLGHPLDVRKVTGSNPVRPTKTNKNVWLNQESTKRG